MSNTKAKELFELFARSKSSPFNRFFEDLIGYSDLIELAKWMEKNSRGYTLLDYMSWQKKVPVGFTPFFGYAQNPKIFTHME